MLEYRHLDTRYVKKTLYCCYSLEISAFNVFQLDRLQKEALKVSNVEAAASLRFWSTTLRCMLTESFHGYGVTLWKIASLSFESAEDCLREKLRIAIDIGNKTEEERIKVAISLCRFIPPQFRKTNN